ncbi:DNA replication terminus site-binding protein [Thiolapillus sp.]|uniref:DNA replication terminus site-binding protein n=2 Tax=Thiolapillus sp. TaxID=2017437 RepID=UPI003AF8220A
MTHCYEYSVALEHAQEQKEQLTTRLADLNRHLRTLDGYPVWVYGCRTDAEARDRCVEIYGSLHYADEMKPEESMKVYGVVGGDQALIELAKDVNQSKDEFAAAMQELRRTINPGTSRNQRGRALRLALEKLRVPRFHYRQAIRKIKFLEDRPEKLRFTWLRTHDLHRITREQAIEKLRKQIGDNALQDSRDYRILASLASGEVLAEVRPTNLDVHLHLHWGTRGIQAMQVNMPVIFPSEKGGEIPCFRPLISPEEMGPKRKRNNRKIEDEPVLSGMNLYRYKSEHRTYV